MESPFKRVATTALAFAALLGLGAGSVTTRTTRLSGRRAYPLIPEQKIAALDLEIQRRSVKCCVCDLGSVAPLLRLDKVHPLIAAHRQKTGEAKRVTEYVHKGSCVTRIHKKHGERKVKHVRGEAAVA